MINWMSFSYFRKHLIQRIKIGVPFSMVRMGDGEFIVIKYPRFSKETELRARFRRWFDVSDIHIKHLNYLRNEIYSSCRYADMLGIPGQRESLTYPKWNRIKPFHSMMESLCLIQPQVKYFHFYFMNQLHSSRLINDLLQYIDSVVLITCRDVQTQFKDKFDVKNVETFSVPPEAYRFRNSPRLTEDKNKWNGTSHYPEVYESIDRRIRKTAWGKGKLALVGAGGLGKIYCHRIKQCGGMALDIGALFDGWAGIYTRPYLKNPKRFEL